MKWEIVDKIMSFQVFVNVVENPSVYMQEIGIIEGGSLIVKGLRLEFESKELKEG